MAILQDGSIVLVSEEVVKNKQVNCPLSMHKNVQLKEEAAVKRSGRCISIFKRFLFFYDR